MSKPVARRHGVGDEVLKRLGDDAEIAVSSNSRIIALRFGFKPGPTYCHAAMSHVKERLEGLKNLEDVQYADERFWHAWDN